MIMNCSVLLCSVRYCCELFCIVLYVTSCITTILAREGSCFSGKQNPDCQCNRGVKNEWMNFLQVFSRHAEVLNNDLHLTWRKRFAIGFIANPCQLDQ